MREYKIKLDTVQKVKDFIHTASQCPSKMDLCSDHYIVDAKSIMGVFSLDLSKEILLKIYTDDIGQDNLDKIAVFVTK